MDSKQPFHSLGSLRLKSKQRVLVGIVGIKCSEVKVKLCHTWHLGWTSHILKHMLLYGYTNETVSTEINC